ncbi:hypothetical protein Hdeb2414_s0010g00333471 [Helianthus debilis subsp. tardiflorus]
MLCRSGCIFQNYGTVGIGEPMEIRVPNRRSLFRSLSFLLPLCNEDTSPVTPALIFRGVTAYAQDMLNRGIANIHVLATTAADPNLEQMLAPQPQLPISDQPMEIENPENQTEMPDYNPEQIPRVHAPNPLDPNNYDPWWDDVRDYVQQNLIQENVPMPNLGAYPGLDPQDPYYVNDAYIREILENPYPYQAPYQEPAPQIPNLVLEPAPPMSAENVQELRTFGEEILESSERMRQVGERLVWKYDERNMDFWMNPYQ